MSSSPGSLGLVVPCRNEAGVIARRLRNLAHIDWPALPAAHRVIVVDDGSEDDTRALVEQVLAVQEFPSNVSVEVIGNDQRPGKPGAIRAGLDRLGEEFELVGISDADVLLGERTLVKLIGAFGSDPQLAMACGEQRFVSGLPSGGVIERSSDHELEARADFYDRATAWWRRLESRAGALFSVHGQILLWRASLSLRPRLGLAADDLDLMLQVREAQPRARIELVAGATFFEAKVDPRKDGEVQATRRARAYFQFIRSRERLEGQSPGRALQWFAYRSLPGAASWGTLLVVSTTLIFTLRGAGLPAALGLLALWGMLFLSPPGRTLLRILRVIRAARRLEDSESLPERWEMARNG